MGHTLYIAAVSAPKPTHVVFSLENGTPQIICGPAKFEQLAGELRDEFDADFIRDLPEEIERIEHDGKILRLEPMKSWHYIPFERIITKEQRSAQMI